MGRGTYVLVLVAHVVPAVSMQHNTLSLCDDFLSSCMQPWCNVLIARVQTSLVCHDAGTPRLPDMVADSEDQDLL